MNTALVVILQVRASRGGDTVAGAARLGRRATVATALACLLMAVAARPGPWTAAAVLVLAVGTLTAGELWSSAAAWGWRYSLAPADGQGEHGGAFSLGSALRVVVGPAAVTGLLTLGSWGLVLLALAFLGVGQLVRPLVGWAERTRPPAVA